MQDIATEVAVLQTKLQSIKAVATSHARMQTIEATSDLMKEIAALQPKMQAKEATNDNRALQTKIEAIEGKLEAAEREIEVLQNKVKCLQLYVYQFYYKSYPLESCFVSSNTVTNIKWTKTDKAQYCKIFMNIFNILLINCLLHL